MESACSAKLHHPSRGLLLTKHPSISILRGLAPDGGLYIPEEIPSLPPNWQNDWRDFTFQELAFEVFSLFISPAEIPPSDLRDIIHNSYKTFRVPGIAPTVTLDSDTKIYLLELFHGPTL